MDKIALHQQKDYHNNIMYDVSGKGILKRDRSGRTGSIDLSALPPGLYLLKRYDDELYAIKKMIIVQ